MTEAKRSNYIALLDSVLQSDIHELLKAYKDDHKDDIKLSGNKSVLITNLLDAIENGIISETDLQVLIKDSEEYGDQYIYFYEPVSNDVIKRYNDGNDLINGVIHASVRAGFPKLRLTPTSFEWSDFRFPNRGIKDTWMIKMYDKKTKEVKLDGEKFDAVNKRRTVVYQTIESRLIYIVEWNSRNQLEIKISRTSFDSNKSIDSAMRLIRTNIYNHGKGIDTQEEVVPVDLTGCIKNILKSYNKNILDLTGCIKNILKSYNKNKKVYKLLYASFLDTQFGKASMRCYDDQGNNDLLSEASRRKAIEAYMDGESKADGVHVKFLADGSNGELKGDISVIIGKDAINKIIIPGKIGPQEYNYVRRKIAEFS